MYKSALDGQLRIAENLSLEKHTVTKPSHQLQTVADVNRFLYKNREDMR